MHHWTVFPGVVVLVVEGEDCSGLSCLLSGPHSIEKIFEKTQKYFKGDRLKARIKFDTASAVVFQNTLEKNFVN
jgi:hypothetical protein